MALDGIIFDLDGTLLETNRLHTRAWAMTMEEYGFKVREDRIAPQIGKGGSMLVPDVLGPSAEEELGDEMRDRHSEYYQQLIEQEGVRVYPQVEDLIRACKERGLRVAVATASKEENLEKVLDVAGLDLKSMADGVVTDSDVDLSKPHPDVVIAAHEKIGLAPTQCVMVGDTPYDAQAARSGGVTAIGLLTGVHEADVMRRSGMRAVYDDTADLLAHLDEALEAASPGEGRMRADMVEQLMRAALAEADAALEAGVFPAGAVLARSDGTIIRTARDVGHRLEHPELQLLMEVDPEEGDDLVLVSTLEPCAMCYGAAVQSRIDTIIYGLATEDGRTQRYMDSTERYPRVVADVLAHEVRRVVDSYAQRNGGEGSLASRLAGWVDAGT